MKTKQRLVRGLAIAMTAGLLACVVACGKKAGNDDIVASVDGRKISRVDLEKYYDNQQAESQQKLSGEQATSLRLGILRQLIDNEILMRRAEKLGLLATDDEVERKLSEIKSPFTNEQFDARLKEKKITMDDFKREVRRSLTVEKVLNKEITSKISVSDQDITQYYNDHRSEFNFIETQYHLAHIWVTSSPNPQVHNQKNDKAQNEGEARKKIEMIANRLDSGDDFAALAANYSEDPETSGNGGDLGFTPESSLHNTDPNTRDIVMSLKAGQYSPVIPVVNPMNKQVAGYRIVKLIAKEPAGQQQLSDPRVQQAIRSQLRERREQILRGAYEEVMRDNAKVENFYAAKVLANSGVL